MSFKAIEICIVGKHRQTINWFDTLMEADLVAKKLVQSGHGTIEVWCHEDVVLRTTLEVVFKAPQCIRVYTLKSGNNYMYFSDGRFIGGA